MTKDKIAVFGQGYVGLPLALSFAMRGFFVYGVDIDKSLVQELKNGYTNHLESYQGKSIQTILQEELDSTRYQPTLDCESSLSDVNNIVVTVGAPVYNGQVDYEPIKKVSKEIGKNLKKDDLVLFRSTVVPGTTEGIVREILERESGFTAGVDFDLAYSSERIAEGKAFHEFSDMPTLVAGVTDKSRIRSEELLKTLFNDGGKIVSSPSIEAVELSKVFENLSRDVNIAMVNEFSSICEQLGLDIHHVIDLANTHHRVNLLRPGPGVGGFCIPNAYYYLLPKAKEVGASIEMSATARKINDNRPLQVVNRIEEKLLEAGKDIENCKIAVLGLAMKDYSSDHRLSPALEVVRSLQKRTKQVSCYDPEVKSDVIPGQVNSLHDCVKDAHALVFLTRQDEFDNLDYGNIRDQMVANPHPPFILDTKGALSRKGITENGMSYVLM
ncbi:nucleotide sugar dehydrogenase [Natranaerobius trueperi]|uniref:Nucleotide sugar dehydrogenase n=2 Tax=Natranaerobius trueperi TaxID=759412 RepID=A0A226C192_9FIRM|nr:nucleotide sugar dehydrogenase [Natranaerobius trueperi]